MYIRDDLFLTDNASATVLCVLFHAIYMRLLYNLQSQVSDEWYLGVWSCDEFHEKNSFFQEIDHEGAKE